jgi:hypothetical protein
MTTAEYERGLTSYPPSVWAPPGPVDPHITALAPSTGSLAAAPLTVTVTGTGFEAGSVVEVDQVPATSTVFVSATELTATFTPTVEGAAAFTVRNVNDEESNSTPYTVTA